MATQRQTVERPKSPERHPPDARPGFSDEALLLTDAPVPGLRRAAGQARPLGEEKELWVESVSDWSRLEALEAEWSELAAAAAEPNPFYEPWMLLPALRSFGGGRKLEVVLVFAPHPTRAKGPKQLCGLFPIERRRGRTELWKHPYCYLATPLLRAARARAALACFCDFLAASAGLVRMDDVPGDGAFRLLLVDELTRRGWPSCIPAAYTRAVLRRACTGDEFLERALCGKRRKELRRQRARLAEQGRLELDELRPGADVRPWIREFLELEASGWKGRSGVAAALRTDHRAYLEEAAVRAGAAGRLMMLALRLDGRPIALKCNLLSGPGSFAFKIAFDEQFAPYSPGVLLELENVRRVHELPHLHWMDSCAAPNRFMINHLWPDRRELQTVFFSTGHALPSLAVAIVPLVHFFRARLRRCLRRNQP